MSQSSPVTAIILGYGIRGRAYASYATTHPEDFQIAGIADPVAEMPATPGLPTWKRWEDAIDSGVKAKTSDGGSVKIAARLAPMHDGTGPYNSIASLLGNGQNAGLWVALAKWTYLVTGAGSWYYVTPI